MAKKIVVFFTQDEYSAIFELAIREFRTVPDQMHYMIRKELERLNLLPVTEEEGGNNDK